MSLKINTNDDPPTLTFEEKLAALGNKLITDYDADMYFEADGGDVRLTQHDTVRDFEASYYWDAASLRELAAYCTKIADLMDAT